MFVRVVRESFARKRRRKLIAITAVALGATVASAMLAVALGIGDKINRELRSYGANIEALPRYRPLKVTAGGIDYRATASTNYISEQDLPKLKSVFWSNNILAFAPFTYAAADARVPGRQASVVDAQLVGTWFEHELQLEEGKTFRTGVRLVSPWWRVRGGWPSDNECLVGDVLAERLGAQLGDELLLTREQASARLRISGIVSTGSEEDNQVITQLGVVQRLAGLENKIDRVEVSALTNPDDELALKDPAKLTPEEYERWSCTPYVRSVAADVEKALGGTEARPILRISQSEGALLSKIDLMMLLVAAAALAASVLGVASTMMTTVLERRSEIGLLKAIGASNANVVAIFLAEAAIVGICGGIAGMAAGYGLAQLIARTVFDSALEVSSLLAPFVLLISIGVAFAGSAWPLRTALRFDPSLVLRGQ